MTDRAADLDAFYRILDALRVRLGGYRHLNQATGRSGWPERGVYFFFEEGELREEGRTLRVVRVGTHAVYIDSKTKLWHRLSQHKGTTGGSLPGGGNHRGSVFRRHVGTALLKKGLYPQAVGTTWGQGNTASRQIRTSEYTLELSVSAYIRALPFLWLAVPGEAAATSDRKVIEANAIALLSNYGRSLIDPPSPNWLGRRTADPKIRASGLWNVNHVSESYEPGFLDLLARYVQQA